MLLIIHNSITIIIIYRIIIYISLIVIKFNASIERKKICYFYLNNYIYIYDYLYEPVTHLQPGQYYLTCGRIRVYQRNVKQILHTIKIT